jgi:L-fuconolactonase
MSTLSRRDLLKATAALTAAGLSQVRAADAAALRIIDAHTHFYDPTRPQGVPWPGKDDAVLYRRVLPENFRAVAGPLGVVATIAIEASPWLEDNQWLLNLAAGSPTIVGVIGHLDPGGDGFAQNLARFARNPLFRGIRINGDSLLEDLGRARYRDDLKRLADRGLTLDVNGSTVLLPGVATLADFVPGLRVVINHKANVRIDGGEVDADWLAGLRVAARSPDVSCKVSALVENTTRPEGRVPTKLAFYKPVLDALWETFGEDRLIYGSDWPVSDRFADYKTVLGIVRDDVKGRGPAASLKFFERNAEVAYRVSLRS